MELKRLDLTKPSFMANGREYFIEGSLSISRFCEFQILEKELSFSTSFKSLFTDLRGIYDLLNEMKLADGIVRLNNVLNGVAKLEEKEPTGLKICTLFINTKDEDRTEWSNDLMTQKIEDWKIEGYDVADFFRLALNSVDGFADIYREISQRISPNLTERGAE